MCVTIAKCGSLYGTQLVVSGVCGVGALAIHSWLVLCRNIGGVTDAGRVNASGSIR